MESNLPSHKNGMKIQIREAYGRLVYTYTTHLKQAGRLIKINDGIKLIQIGLSAISSGGFIGTVITNETFLSWIGGGFSIGLLIFNLIIKEYNIADDVSNHRKTADALWIVREKYISLLTDFDFLSVEDIIQKRDELQEKTIEIYSTAPSTDAKSYKAAQKALKDEEEQYFQSFEIDRILPEHLRMENDQGQESEV